jgi:hypothetical protein
MVIDLSVYENNCRRIYVKKSVDGANKFRPFTQIMPN